MKLIIMVQMLFALVLSNIQEMDDNINQDEIQEVINLPCLVGNVTDHEISDVEKDYYTNNEKKHDEMFGKMHDELKLLCDEIEKELIQRSEMATSEINYFNQSTKNIANNTEVTSADEWIKLFELSTKLEEDYNLILTSFSSDVSELEQKRAVKVEQILSIYRKQAGIVLALKPEELNHIFEKKVLEINAITLSNFQTYTDLHLHLKLLGKKMLKEYIQTISERSNIWAEEEAVNEQGSEMSDSAQLDFILSLSEEGSKAKANFMQTINSLAKAVSELGNKFSEDEDLLLETSNLWTEEMIYLSEKMEITVLKLDEAVKLILQLYKEGKKVVSDRYDQEVKVIERDLSGNSMEEVVLSQKHTQFRTETNEIEHDNFDVKNIEVLWDMLQINLIQQVQHNHQYLTSIVKIRDDHLKRIQECKTAIKSSIAQIVDRNHINRQEKFIKINILLDSLRQESSQEKLKKTFDEVTTVLDDIRESFGTTYNSTVDVIDEIPRLIDLEVPIVQAELTQMQKQYSNELYLDRNLDKLYRENHSTSRNNLQSEINFQMKECLSYVQAINIWNLGLYDELERFLTKIEPKLKEDAEKWLSTEIQEVVKIYDLDLQRHQLQYRRIEQEIKAVRESELDVHTERLKSHCAGVHKSLEDLLNKVKESQSKIQQMKKYYDEKHEEIDPATLKFTKSYQVKKKITELESEFIKHMEVMKTLAKEQQQECDDVLLWLTRSNADFLSSVKLFSEGGNYSPEEVSLLTGELNKLNKDIDKQRSVLRKHCEVLMESSNQISNSKNILIIRLQELIKQLTLNESISDIVVDVQESLKKEVFKMKCGGKTLMNFESLVKKNNEDSELLSTLNSRHDYLIIPEASSTIEICININHSNFDYQPRSVEMKIENELCEWVILKKDNVKNSQVQQDDSLNITASRKTKSNISTKIDHVNDITPENWKKKLFKFTNVEKLTNENNFLAASKICLLKGLSKISGILQHTSVEKETRPKSKSQKLDKKSFKQEKSSNQYSLYMDDLLNKFIFYNEQCEKTWFLQVEEFMLQLMAIKKYCNRYIKLEFENAHGNCLAEINELSRNYITEMKCYGESTRISRLSMNHSLLPLHGHPNNKIKLKKLTEEAGKLATQQLSKHGEFLAQYKADLQQKYNSYIDTLQCIEKALSSIQKEIFSPDLAFTLISQIVAIINENTKRITLNKIIGNPVQPPNTPSSNVIDEEATVAPKKSLQLVEVDNFMKWSFLINSLKANMMTFNGTVMFEDNLSLASSEFIIPVNILCVIAVNVKELIEKLENLYEDAQIEHQHYAKLLDYFLHSWSFNVEEVQKLYHICG